MRLTIFSKLLLGFAAIVLLTVGLAIFQLISFSRATALLDVVAHDDAQILATVAHVAEGRAILQSRREMAMTTVVTNGIVDHDLDELQRRYQTAMRDALAALAALSTLSGDKSRTGATAARRVLWRDLAGEVPEVAAMLREISGLAEPLFAALRQDRIADAATLRRSINVINEGLEDQLDDLAALARRLSEAGRADAADAFDTVLLSTAVAVLLVVVLAALIAYLIGRSISRPLVQSIALAQAIGQGDLSREMAEARSDELGDLARALNGMVVNLRRVALQTRSAAENLNGATAQIRASSRQQAAAVTEQLAAIEQTTATLTEITQSGAHMSERAQQIIAGADETAGTSDQGLRAVEETVSVMDGIREQVETVAENIVMLSQRTQAIGDIILTVNTIAERSHLLALNASIEAAAAGEHGRTFSVVAGEIKKLADQAKEATAQVRSNLGEIQQGINASVMLTEEATKRVAGGRRQTEAAERTIRDMTDSIQDNLQAFQQIVAGINQHQIGLEQVMSALQNIRSASTQTSTGTRQLEDAAGNLSTLSEGLLGAVRNYRT